MNYKKITATLLTATLVVANCVPVLADTVTGAGKVEYDNSEAVAYDSVTVPVTVTNSTYAFELDPAGLLKSYGGVNYKTASVYFSSDDEKAYVTGATTTVEETDVTTILAKKSYASQTATEGKWTGVVSDGDNNAKVVADDYYVWTPQSTKPSGYTGGTAGTWTALTASNITNWFEIGEDNTISLLPDHMAGDYVCDGKLYKATYTDLTDNKQLDSDADPIVNYVTIGANDAVTAVKDLYKKVVTGEGDDAVTSYVEAGVADVKYVPAVVKHDGESKVAYLVNKSTKEKTLSVKVTLKNAEGLTINDSSTFADSDKSASIYIAAKNGSTENALEEVDGVVSKTFTVDLPAATDAGETLYQTEGPDEITGGHVYKRYTGPTPTYTNNSFSIVAAANTYAINGTTDADKAKAKAWMDYSKAIEEGKTPQLEVVYTVTDKQTTPVYPWSALSGATITGNDSPYTLAITADTATITFKNDVTKLEYRAGSEEDFTEYSNSPNVSSEDAVVSIVKTYYDKKNSGFQIRVTTSEGMTIFTK